MFFEKSTVSALRFTGNQVVVLSELVLLLCLKQFSYSFAVVPFLEVLPDRNGPPRRVRRTLDFSYPNFSRQGLLIVCISVPSFQNRLARTVLWKFGFSQHVTF